MSSKRDGIKRLAEALGKRSTRWNYSGLRRKYVSRERAEKLKVDYAATPLPNIVSVAVPEVWVRDVHPKNAAWSVAFRIVSRGNQPVIGEVRIFPTETGTKEIDGWSAELLGVKA